MTVQQLSVFIENRRGRLGEVLKVLKENDVSILSMSLADTTEYGLLRLIVNKPEAGKNALSDAGFSSVLAEVIIVKVPHVSGALQNILELIAENEIDIEYMYGLSIESNEAYVVLKASNIQKVDEVLTENGVRTLTCEELAQLYAC